MLSVFGDESHDGKSERVFVVAGICGTQEEWDPLVGKWLARTDGKVFHAADCESDRGNFKGIPHDQNLKLYEDLTILLSESGLTGVGVAFDVATFHRLFPQTLNDVGYYKAFMEVIKFYAKVAATCRPEERVKFVFEQRLETDYNAAALYRYLRNLPEWRYHAALGEIGFSDKDGATELQAADLLARETMKIFKVLFSGGTIEKGRKSAIALAESGWFSYVGLGPESIEHWRDQVEQLERRTGLSRDQYADWKREHGCQDTLDNRLQFVVYRDDVQRESGGLVM